MGNIRLSYFKNAGGSAEVLEENNYYPFGLKHEGYNALNGNPAYQYKYNGKELQEETGWNDYGARMYMSDIARWGVMDPLAEQYRAWSPYNYAVNNPVSFIDPDGRSVQYANGGINFTGDSAVSFGALLIGQAQAQNAAGGSKIDRISAFEETGGGGDGGVWGSIKNFFSGLFGSKNKQADVVPIAGAAPTAIRPPVYVGQLEKVGRVLTIEQVTAALGTIMGKSVWALPLMLNGDSAGAPAYDVPLTGATDVPADEPLGILLYRGIAAPKNALQLEMYSQGLVGTAIPNGLRTVSTLKGPHRSQDLHAEGDNYSIWTSWTTDPIVAKHFSGGAGGIILSKYFRAGQAMPNLSITAEGNSIPSGRPESEWLVPGIVYGASVQIIK